MALSFSTTVRNAELDVIESTISTAPILKIYSGTVPAAAGTSITSQTILATGTLPSDWLAAASSGAKAKSGTWTLTGQSGAGSGTAGTFFRITDSSDTTCHIQGTVSASGGGGDMTLDNNNIANSQSITVSTFTLTAGNA